MPKGGTPGRTWINARNKDAKNEQDALCIELTGRQRERFEEVRAECSDDFTPEPTDEQIVKSLLDTWDAVGEGHYSGEADE